MKSAIIIYESRVGNTAKVAQWLARGLEDRGVLVALRRTEGLDPKEAMVYDAVLVGGPTHYHGISDGIRGFLSSLERGSLKGKKGLAFDTRMDHPLSGSAAKAIRRKLRAKGLSVSSPPLSVLVQGREGPINASAEDGIVGAGHRLAEELSREG